MKKRHLLLLIFEIAFCVPMGALVLYYSYTTGYISIPAFQLGAIVFTVFIIYYKRILRVKDEYWFAPYIIPALALFVFLLRGVSEVHYFLYGGALCVIPLLVLGVREVLVELPMQDQPRAERITVTEEAPSIHINEGDSREIRRFIVSGFGHDYKFLSKLVHALSNGKNLVAYVYYEYERGGENFEILEKDNPRRIRFTVDGKPGRRRAAAYECTESSIRESVVDIYWLWKRRTGGDYRCIILPYDGDFESIAKRMDDLLYRNEDMDSFIELAKSHDFVITAMGRNKNELRGMKIVTKLSLEEVSKRLSIVATLDH